MACGNPPVTEQERDRPDQALDDIEPDDNAKPANSHVALNVITDDDGNERKDRAMPTCRSARPARASTALTSSDIRACQR